MRLFFGLLCLSLLLPAVPLHAEQQVVRCGQCEEIVSEVPHPSQIKLVCFPFIQPRAAQVKIFIYDEQGREIYRHAKDANPIDKYCIGAWRLQSAVEVVICNDDASSTLDANLVGDVRTRGGLPEGDFMCLYDECATE